MARFALGPVQAFAHVPTRAERGIREPRGRACHPEAARRRTDWRIGAEIAKVVVPRVAGRNPMDRADATRAPDHHADATRAPLDAVPDDVLAQLLGLLDGAALLRAEMTGRRLRDTIRGREGHIWSGALRARWQREGVALCSLGAPRKVYHAFCTRLEDGNRHLSTLRGPFEEEPLGTSEDRLAFIFCVGRFAGVARWTEVPDRAFARNNFFTRGLRWQPQPNETCFDLTYPDDVHEWDEDTTSENTRGHLEQTLHVIDMQSFQCVTLFSDVLPLHLEIIDNMDNLAHIHTHIEILDGDTFVYSPAQKFYRYSPQADLDLETDDELDDLDFHSLPSGVDPCEIDPLLTLRADAENVLRLHAADMDVVNYGQNTTQFHDFVVDIIQQTHAR